MGRTSKDLEATVERVERLRLRYDQLRRRLMRTIGTDDLERLDTSIARRRARIRHLDAQIEALESDRERLRGELIGCLHGAEALLVDLVDQLETLDGPAWSPTPIVGYSVFAVTDGRVTDGDHLWQESLLRPQCPGGLEDQPHEDASCRNEACGVLAWKTLDRLPDPAGGDLAAVVAVSLSGRIVEHTNGYRGETGRVAAMLAFDEDRWFRTRNREQIRSFITAPIDTFESLAAPIPGDGMLYLELDLFFGSVP